MRFNFLDDLVSLFVFITKHRMYYVLQEYETKTKSLLWNRLLSYLTSQLRRFENVGFKTTRWKLKLFHWIEFFAKPLKPQTNYSGISRCTLEQWPHHKYNRTYETWENFQQREYRWVMLKLILFTLELKHLIYDFLLLWDGRPIVKTNLKWDGHADWVSVPPGKPLLQ